MIKLKFLMAFIERLNSYQIIHTQSFLAIYDYWFIEVTKNLENEIYKNILLPSTDKTAYLGYIKKQVIDKVPYRSDNQFLNEWIKKYELDGLNFPFIENEEVEQILDTYANHPGLNYTSKKLCTNMQMDFYCHAAMLEKYKMIAFIDKLLVTETTKHKSVVSGEELVINTEVKVITEISVNPHDQIFLNADAYKLFQKLFEAFKHTKFLLADFSFIYRTMYKDKLIKDAFKPQMFIDWLNKEPYNICLSKVKTLNDSSTTGKTQTYNASKEILQIK